MGKLEKPKLFSLMLNGDQLKSLKDISSFTMIPQAALIRHGIDLVIQKYQGELKKSKRKGVRI